MASIDVFCEQMQRSGDESVDVDDNASDDDNNILSDSSGMLKTMFGRTSDPEPSLKPNSLAAASSSSSSSSSSLSSGIQQLVSIRRMADMFARGMMSADFAAEARPGPCPLLQSPQWSNELAVATLAGMRAVAELNAVELFLADDEDTEANARIRGRLLHILSLPPDQQ